MNDLLTAAKSVIDAEFVSQQKAALKNLRAAVERAEKPPADFEAWEESSNICPSEYTAAACAWIAAQQAERERCREIVITMGGPDVPELLQQIDSGEE